MNERNEKRKYQREWYNKHRKDNPEYAKEKREYTKRWREKFGEDYRKANLDKIRSYDREWKRQSYLKDPELARKKRRERYRRERKNPEYVERRRAYMRDYLKKWRTGNNKIAACLRTRINMALKHGKKCASTLELTGISLVGLKKHIEGQFKEGMTWENYGKWHVDHKFPLAKSDLSNLEGQKKAFHFSNLQPLWAKENVSKGTRILIK